MPDPTVGEGRLRDLRRRFSHVYLWRDYPHYRIEAWRPMAGDSRWYAPRAWATTARGAIDLLWERA